MTRCNSAMRTPSLCWIASTLSSPRRLVPAWLPLLASCVNPLREVFVCAAIMDSVLPVCLEKVE